MYRNALATALVTAVALAGCGSGDDDAASEPAAAEADEPADDGGGNGGGDAGGGDDSGAVAVTGSDRPASLRDDYPVPFPEGWEVDLMGEIGLTETSGAQLLYPTDAYDELVAFYDEWLESQPEEFVRSEVGEQIIYQQLGDVLYQISIDPAYEERGETWVILQVFGGEVN